MGRGEAVGRGVDLLLARVEQRMELEPAARGKGGQMAGQRSRSQADDADLDHGSSGTAFSMTWMSSNRMPPGDRRNATSTAEAGVHPRDRRDLDRSGRERG